MTWIFVAVAVLLTIIGVWSARGSASNPNPNANEPDVFASEDADLDPESDTGEPAGWNIADECLDEHVNGYNFFGNRALAVPLSFCLRCSLCSVARCE